MPFQGKTFEFTEVTRPNDLTSTEILKILNNIIDNNTLVEKYKKLNGITDPIMYRGIPVKDFLLLNAKNVPIRVAGKAYRIPTHLASYPKYKLEVYDTGYYQVQRNYYIAKGSDGDMLIIFPNRTNNTNAIDIIFNPYNRGVIELAVNQQMDISKNDPRLLTAFNFVKLTDLNSYPLIETPTVFSTHYRITGSSNSLTDIIISDPVSIISGVPPFSNNLIYANTILNGDSTISVIQDYSIGKTNIDAGINTSGSVRYYNQITSLALNDDLQNPDYDIDLAIAGISPLGNTLRKLLDYPDSKKSIITKFCRNMLFITGDEIFTAGKKYISPGVFEYGLISETMPGHSELHVLDCSPKTYVPKRIRYIKNGRKGNNINSGNHPIEIRAYSDGINVALNKPVYLYKYDGSLLTLEDQAKVTDGNLTDSLNGSDWETLLYSVKVDLLDLYDITHLNIIFYNTDSRFYNSNMVWVSDDNINWYPIYNSDIDGTYIETAGGKDFYIAETLLPVSCTNSNYGRSLIPEYMEGTVETINGAQVVSSFPGSGKYYAFIPGIRDTTDLLVKLTEDTSSIRKQSEDQKGISIIYNDSEGWYGPPKYIESRWKSMTGTKVSLNLQDLFLSFTFTKAFDRIEPQVLEIMNNFDIPYVYSLETYHSQYANKRVYTNPEVGEFDPFEMMSILKTDKHRAILNKEIESLKIDILPDSYIEKISVGSQTRLVDHILNLSDFIPYLDTLILNGIIIRPKHITEPKHGSYVIYNFTEVIKDIIIIRSKSDNRFIAKKINEVYCNDIERGFNRSLGTYNNKPATIVDEIYLQPVVTQLSEKSSFDVLIHDYIINNRIKNIVSKDNNTSNVNITKDDIKTKFARINAENLLEATNEGKDKVVMVSNSDTIRRGYIVRK